MEDSASPKRPLFLTGEEDIGLDAKNRIVIPASFRKEILEARHENKLVILIGRNRVPWMYPAQYYRDELIAQRKPNLVPGEDEERFNEAFYGMVFPLEWDEPAGRVVIPPKIIQRSNLSKNLTLVGARDHIAIWNRDEWERRAMSHLDSWSEIQDRDRRSTTTVTKSDS